jgi:hypothetical protein
VNGPVGSPELTGFKAVAKRFGQVNFSTSYAKDAIGPDFPLAFHALQAPATCGPILIGMAKERFGFDSAMLIGPNDQGGTDATRALAQMYSDAGVEATEEYYQRGTTNFAAIAARIMNNNPTSSSSRRCRRATRPSCGSDGIAGVPAATLFGIDFGTPRLLVVVTIIVGIVAALITLAVTHRFRPEFSSIEENETLAESLGVPVWWYRAIGFVASAGVSGLAGFALVHMLATAHPSSFASFSAVNYIAYAFIGGRGTILGSMIGAGLLVTMQNLFSSQGQFSMALFGMLLIGVVMAAPGGLVEIGRRFLGALRPQPAKVTP